MSIQEHRFTVVAGGQTLSIIIEEFVGGRTGWPAKFRSKLPASCHSSAATFYGATCHEAAEKAAKFLASQLGLPEMHRVTYRSQGPPYAPPLLLQIQE